MRFASAISIFTGFITVIFTLLTYSIASGIGMGLIAYLVMLMFAKRWKDINVTLIVIAILFLISFVLSAVLNVINQT